MKKTQKFLENWEKNRQKGKSKYVLTNGTMMGTALLIGSILGKLITGNFFNLLIQCYVYRHLPYFFGGFIGGIIGSLQTWSMNEVKYNYLINSKEQ